ncbi:MAG: major capsid protein [Bacillota bacterium]
MSMTNQELLEKAITTTDLQGTGALTIEQAKEFWRMTFEATPFSKLHRKELRKATTGTIPKIGIGRRILRKQVEGADDNYRAGLVLGSVPYACVDVRLPWEITEKTIRENIEGENFEDTVMQLMTTQLGIDLEDLHFNGDTSSSDPFLSINDGWVKQIKNGTGAHVIDCTADSGFGKATLLKILRALPGKYRGPNTKWLMSPTRRLLWIEYLTQRNTAAGDAALIGAGDQVNKPFGFEIVEVPSLADDIIILTDPQNFVAVNTYDVRIRKTVEGKEAIMEDKRFYVIHFNDDPIIQELDACVLAYNIPTTLATS